jgi:IS605 OrfB family transposase
MGKVPKHKIQNFSHLCSKENVFLPNNQTIYHPISTTSWFNQRITKNDSQLTLSEMNPTPETYFTKKYNFYPNQVQVKILEQWFQGTTYLYNKALKYIKQQKYYYMSNKQIRQELTLNKIREVLKEEKKIVSTFIKDKLLSIPNLDTKYSSKLEKIGNETKQKTSSSIPSHIMDRAIGKAIEMYKSALSNFRAHNIQKFRMRYLKHGMRSNKNIYIEPSYVMKNGTITNLGELKIIDPETDMEYKIEKKNIQNEFQIRYVAKKQIYEIFFVFERENLYENKEREDFISLDPGVTPFLAGVSKDNSVFIGENCRNKMKKYLEKIDGYNNAIYMKKSKRVEAIERVRMKIKNVASDLHWKVIGFLTTNYNRILIGDLSVKSIVELKGAKMTKRILHSYGLFTFKQRLKYKCEERGIFYREINEYRTSKTCSVCGHKKHNLGMNKRYQCIRCGNDIHRDINGARCIYFASLLDTSLL